MGGLAARLAGERYLGIELDRGRHAAELTAALGGIKGPLMKVAQLLATIPDALPKEYAQRAGLSCRPNAPSMGWPFVKRRMASELGADWRATLRELRARSGARRLARPGASRRRAWTARRSPASCNIPIWARRSKPICGSSNSSSRSMSATTAPSPPTRSMPRSPTRLREELDYEREAAHMRLYRADARRREGRAPCRSRCRRSRPRGC